MSITIEERIMETYKNVIEIYNIIGESEDSYISGRIDGIKEMAQSLGYVLYAHHRNNCIGLPYDYVSISKDGNVIKELSV